MICPNAIILAVTAFVSLANALIPIQTKGSRFIKPATKASNDGEVFFIKGVDYQIGGSSSYSGNADDGDVLSDADVCYRDAYVLQQAQVNTIRIYTVNPDVNHDKCMSIFNDAGIYVILDVNSALSGESLNRDDPASSYNANYLKRVFKVIDAFKAYPNLLGLFAGNEIVNSEKSAKGAPPYIRALQRDMKQYIAKHANRTIPVGYSAADEISLRKVTFDYLQCDNGDDSHSDFFGLNSYEWCSGSTFKSSGYSNLNSTFSNASIPLFFSEYGCNTETPRTFEEISKGIYGGLEYTFSGGLVYEYAEEENQYGLVEVDDDSNEVQYKDDFNNFKSQLEKINSTTIIKESAVENRTLPKCSSKLIQSDDSSFNSTFDLPSQPSEISDMIKNGVDGDNEGKIVDVDAKASSYTIKDSDGSEIDNPIVSFDSANLVNQQDGTTATVKSASATSASISSSAALKTASASASSSSSKGDAANYNAGFFTGFAGLFFAMLL